MEKDKDITGKKVTSRENGEKSSKKKKDIKKILMIVALSIVGLIFVLVVGAFLLFHHYYKKLNYDNGDIDFKTTEYTPDGESLASDSDAELIESADAALRANLENNSTPIMFSDDVYNILLIGQDSRDKYTLGRSDSMIIISINKKTDEIIMTSIMRDIYTTIPGVGNARINAAYAYGGADLLIDTIQANFKIKIDSYVAVNFYSFMNVVDAVGGVEITVSDAEVRVLNSYVEEINELEGLPKNDGKLDKGGTYVLTGKQALGYSRIRYVGNADYERTERQRRVLEAVIDKSRNLSLTKLNNLLEEVLPEVLTDIEEGEMLSLILNFTTDYKDYDIKQCRVPYDGTYSGLTIDGADVLGIDFQTNIDNLRRDIYGE
ncbi:MAG: LCP family protein [Wujia sp.]